MHVVFGEHVVFSIKLQVSNILIFAVKWTKLGMHGNG